MLAGTTPTPSDDYPAWVIVMIIVVPSIAGILGGVAAIMAARRAHAVKTHLTQKELEEKEWRENNIGVANGHGTLMRQMTMTMEHVGNLNEHVIDLKDGQAKIMSDVSGVQSELEHHINESAVYRSSVQSTLDEVKGDIGNIGTRLVQHVEWEESQKYPKEWDGTERRRFPPVPLPEGKVERRRPNRVGDTT